MPFEQAEKEQDRVLSQILKREAYSKSGKGGTAIRKFVILKTNKEHTRSYSPFAVVFTDYSAGRKKPLEQEIFLFDDLEDAENKMAGLKAENIKTGWK